MLSVSFCLIVNLTEFVNFVMNLDNSYRKDIVHIVDFYCNLDEISVLSGV